MIVSDRTELAASSLVIGSTQLKYQKQQSNKGKFLPEVFENSNQFHSTQFYGSFAERVGVWSQIFSQPMKINQTQNLSGLYQNKNENR